MVGFLLLTEAFSDSVHYVLYMLDKWRGGCMLASEWVGDGKKMTGLWTREVLGDKRGGGRGQGSEEEK